MRPIIFLFSKCYLTSPKRFRSLACNTHTHPFSGPFSGTTQVNQYQKSKPIRILLKQVTVSGSGKGWAVCKSAPRSRQKTTPAPHHSIFTGRMPFLSPNQQCQSTEGLLTKNRQTHKNESENTARSVIKPSSHRLVAWLSDRTSVSGRRTFPVLRSTCS